MVKIFWNSWLQMDYLQIKKNAMIFLKSKAGQEEAIEINIGNEIIKQHHSAKLLGMTFEDNLNYIIIKVLLLKMFVK